MADGKLSAEEKAEVGALVATATIENPVSGEQVKELGLDYADLPKDTPVEVREGVVITAEVANSLEVLESPAALVGELFNDPALVLTALGNIGADMTEEERTESTQVVVASVIAAGAAVNAAVGAATTTTSGSTGGSSGGGSSGGGGGGTNSGGTTRGRREGQ